MIAWKIWRGSIFSKYGGVWQGSAGSGRVKHATKKTRYINIIDHLEITPIFYQI